MRVMCDGLRYVITVPVYSVCLQYLLSVKYFMPVFSGNQSMMNFFIDLNILHVYIYLFPYLHLYFHAFECEFNASLNVTFLTM